jgi:Na+-transporting NADH:ubiquinone oxidoreductase subunit C
MNKNSSGFTFLFASVMVVLVAVLLSITAIGLGPYQARNARVEKMQNVLASIGVKSNPKDAEYLFRSYLKEQVVLDSKGRPVTGDVEAFDIDLKKEGDKARLGQADKQLFPLFVLEKEGQNYYVIPVRGKGLWGPIWGYMALEGDRNTVYGASFDHKSETPGLGAEINTEAFQNQFKGKKILDETGNFVSVKVVKGGADEVDVHGVDAISGGTVTSNGVTEMLQRTLASYMPYFKQKDGTAAPPPQVKANQGKTVDDKHLTLQ